MVSSWFRHGFVKFSCGGIDDCRCPVSTDIIPLGKVPNPCLLVDQIKAFGMARTLCITFLMILFGARRLPILSNCVRSLLASYSAPTSAHASPPWRCVRDKPMRLSFQIHIILTSMSCLSPHFNNISLELWRQAHTPKQLK